MLNSYGIVLKNFCYFEEYFLFILFLINFDYWFFKLKKVEKKNFFFFDFFRILKIIKFKEIIIKIIFLFLLIID
jgi:hypothetical protein